MQRRGGATRTEERAGEVRTGAGNYKLVGLGKGRRPTCEAGCRKFFDRLFVAGLGCSLGRQPCLPTDTSGRLPLQHHTSCRLRGQNNPCVCVWTFPCAYERDMGVSLQGGSLGYCGEQTGN